MNYINSSEILKGFFTAEELSELTSKIEDLNKKDDNDPEAMYEFIHSSEILGKFIDEAKLSKFKEHITEQLNAIKKKFNLGDAYPTLSDVVNYFETIREIYKGVSITRVITDPPDPLNESFEIKYIPDPPNTKQTDAIQPDPITLITISYEPKIKPEDKEGNKKPPQTLKFTIAANLDDNQMKKALLILNDQAARYQELSRNNKVEIFGFKNNPTEALELYELIIISGRVPTIKEETLKAWEAAAADENNDSKEKFAKALKIYNELNKELDPNNKSGLKNRLKPIQKRLSEEQAEIKRKKLLSKPPEKSAKPHKEESQQQRKQSVNPNGQSASQP